MKYGTLAVGVLIGAIFMFVLATQPRREHVARDAQPAWCWALERSSPAPVAAATRCLVDRFNWDDPELAGIMITAEQLREEERLAAARDSR